MRTIFPLLLPLIPLAVFLLKPTKAKAPTTDTTTTPTNNTTPTTPSLDLDTVYEGCRKLKTLNGTNRTCIREIFHKWLDEGHDRDPNKLSYILATAYHESRFGRYPEELASGDAYEGRADLGNTQPGDGRRYKGRGYVQITGRANYRKFGNLLGLDLEGNPDIAKTPEVAARIIILGMYDGGFTGKALADYITPYHADYKNARRIVNGTDKNTLIAGYAVTIQNSISHA